MASRIQRSTVLGVTRQRSASSFWNNPSTALQHLQLHLQPFIEHYGTRSEGEPERLTEALIYQHVSTGFTLLRELHDLWLLVNESLIAIGALKQASQALRDKTFEQVGLNAGSSVPVRSESIAASECNRHNRTCWRDT